MTETNFTNEQLEAWAAFKDAKYPGIPGMTIVSQIAAALLAERKAREVEVGELRAALKRMLLEFDFMIEANMIADVRNDVIFVEARAALAKMEESK